MARRSPRFSAKEILALIVGTALACTFVIIVAGIIYALVFVTQPVNQQAPNDKAFIEQVLVPIVLWLFGADCGFDPRVPFGIVHRTHLVVHLHVDRAKRVQGF